MSASATQGGHNGIFCLEKNYNCLLLRSKGQLKKCHTAVSLTQETF